MSPDLRLIRYFVAVAEAGNITRAAERLHLSQPSLSAAIRRLEAQLGVELLLRHGRRVTVSPAGAELARLGRELLAQADSVVALVRDTATAKATRLRLGASPTARYGITPRLLAACADHVPAAMLYTTEDTTGALLRDVEHGALDLAVTFCAPDLPSESVALHPLAEEPAIVHLPDTHPLADRDAVTLHDLAGETVLTAASRDSGGYTDQVLQAFEAAGLHPRTRPDPYPDLGRQAVREGLGVVVYVRGAFPATLHGSAFVPIEPPLSLPFHLASHTTRRTPAIDAVLAVAKSLSTPTSETVPASNTSTRTYFSRLLVS